MDQGSRLRQRREDRRRYEILRCEPGQGDSIWFLLPRFLTRSDPQSVMLLYHNNVLRSDGLDPGYYLLTVPSCSIEVTGQKPELKRDCLSHNPDSKSENQQDEKC